MKKINFFLFLIFCVTAARSQPNQINIVNFNVKNTLPAKIDDWISMPGALLLSVQKSPQARDPKPVLVLQIRSGGAIVCGNNLSSARPVDPFDVRTFNAAELIGMLGNCKDLKEGTYSICAQFFNSERKELSREVCKEFKVESQKTDYAPPTLITPENGKKFSIRQLQGLLTFRWTPVVPKPRDPVTYRLRVWQLMQGQNGMQAMKANQPLVSKDVDNITQAAVTGLLTGPCKPPYLCDFIWNVQALNREGKPVGANNGTSENYTFTGGNDIDIQIDSVSVSCCANGKQSFTVIIKNNLTNTVKITQLKVDKVNGVTASILPSPLTPALPVNIAGNGSITFTGQINCIDTAKTIRFYVAAEDAADNAITETEVEEATLKCPCDPCRDMQVALQKDTLLLPKNGNPMQVNLTGVFTGINPNNIKKVTAEIIYFNIVQTKDTNCAKCVYDSKYYGNFILPASSLPGYSGPVLNKLDYSRLITWTSTVIKECGGQPYGDGGGLGDNGKLDPVNYNNAKSFTVAKQSQGATFGEKMAIIGGPGNPDPQPQLPKFILPIAVPEMNSLSCCGDVIKICVRYTFYDFCCRACEVIRCYEIKRGK
jgi:hypothetical protein